MILLQMIVNMVYFLSPLNIIEKSCTFPLSVVIPPDLHLNVSDVNKFIINFAIYYSISYPATLIIKRS